MSEADATKQSGMTVGEVRRALYALNWSAGLTRRQVRRRCRILPQSVYLRLPDSKRYYAADDVLHDARIAPSRAEGEFLGTYPDLDVEEQESLEEGGPPAWGPSPLFTPGGAVDSGSAEDRAPHDARSNESARRAP
jgi:hypothetical protein